MGKKKVGNQLRLPPQARTEKGTLSPQPQGSRGKAELKRPAYAQRIDWVIIVVGNVKGGAQSCSMRHPIEHPHMLACGKLFQPSNHRIDHGFKVTGPDHNTHRLHSAEPAGLQFRSTLNVIGGPLNSAIRTNSRK